MEGFEAQVMEGARDTLNRRPFCCVEIHVGGLLERQGGTAEMVLSHFRDGYELFLNEAPDNSPARACAVRPVAPACRAVQRRRRPGLLGDAEQPALVGAPRRRCRTMAGPVLRGRARLIPAQRCSSAPWLRTPRTSVHRLDHSHDLEAEPSSRAGR